MSYLILARKYRPQTFDEIVGQDHIKKSLKSAVSSGKLSQAYIFSGPRGVGKTSCARILAKSLNCKDGPTLKPCGVCPACMDIIHSRSMDVIEIDGASNRGIDDIRGLRENVRFAPISGKYKIYIIDEVHQITVDGFNALLKTLEEPPPYVKFVFATTASHKIIPTIRSRCQCFEFNPISLSQVADKIREVAREEKINIENDGLLAIARASLGSMRDGLSILDQIASSFAGKIELKDIVSVLGVIEEDLLCDLTDKIIARDAGKALNIVNDFLSQGRDPLLFITALIEHFRNLMIAKTPKANLDKLLVLSTSGRKKIIAQCGFISLFEVLKAIEILINARQMSRHFDLQRISLEMAVIKLSGGFDKNFSSPGKSDRAKEGDDKEAGKDRHSKKDDLKNDCLSQKISSKKEVKAAEYRLDAKNKYKNVSGAKKGIALDHIRDIWQATIEQISKVRMSIATYLNQGNLLRVEDNVLFVGFPKRFRFHKDVLEKRENSEFIERNLSQALNSGLKVNFILCEEAPETAVKKQDIGIDEAVKSTLDVFNGKVVGVS